MVASRVMIHEHDEDHKRSRSGEQKEDLNVPVRRKSEGDIKLDGQPSSDEATYLPSFFSIFFIWELACAVMPTLFPSFCLPPSFCPFSGPCPQWTSLCGGAA